MHQTKEQRNAWLKTEKGRAYRQRHQSKAQSKHRWLLRVKVLTKLGGVCIKCGISDFRVLQINHLNGNGRADFRNHGAQYEKFLKAILSGERNSEDLEARCANCNLLYEYERGKRHDWTNEEASSRPAN